MTLAFRLRAVVQGFPLDDELRRISSQWEKVDFDALDRARTTIGYQLESLGAYAETLGSPGQSDDLYEALAYWYLEVRTEWAHVNLLLNHQLWQKGEVDQSLLLRGSIGSSLLAEVGRLLHPEDVERLEAALTQAMDSLRYSHAATA